MRIDVSVRATAISALLGLVAMALLPTATLAHERRDVGKYSFVVGFNGEPAYQGQPNGAQLAVTVPAEDSRPVEGLADAIKATVAFGGGQPKEFKLRAVFGRPGQYVADFIPTRAGAYIFTFSGTIEGTQVNERFESGPGRFNNVEAVEAIQFPEAIPPGNDVARIARAADDRATAAEAAAESARTFGIAGISLGVLASVIAVIAVGMAVSRRGSVANPAIEPPDALVEGAD